MDDNCEPSRILSRQPPHRIPASRLALKIYIGQVIAAGACDLEAFSMLDELERLLEGADLA
jgi:hypothetical protein